VQLTLKVSKLKIYNLKFLKLSTVSSCMSLLNTSIAKAWICDKMKTKI
jgi:hypothetical protein